MRKTMIMLVSVCAFFSTHAQCKFFKSIQEIGITGGPGVVSFRENWVYQDGEHARPLQNIGFDVKFDLAGHQRLKLNTKVLMEKLGNETWGFVGRYNALNDDYESGSKVFRTDLDYITLPVGLQYHFFRKMNLYATAGLFAGFFRKGRLTIEESFPGEKNVRTYVISNDMKDYNLGWTVGLGYRARVSERSFLFFEANGRYGFENAGSQRPKRSTPAIYTNAVALNLGFSTTIHKRDN